MYEFELVARLCNFPVRQVYIVLLAYCYQLNNYTPFLVCMPLVFTI